MDTNAALIPFLIPMIGAAFCLIPKIPQKMISILALLFNLLYSVWALKSVLSGAYLITFAGGWIAPYGIAFVIDPLSAIMLLASNFVFFVSYFTMRQKSSHSYRPAFIFFLQSGVNLSFATGDFFNLFVAFEIMLTSSYALMVLECEQKKRPHALQYIFLNLLGSFLFLTLSAMVYGATGNLNMAALHGALETVNNKALVLSVGFAVIIVYGLKAGLFPFYFWLPDSYPILPSSLQGLFGGVLTKVGIYVLIRMYLTVLPHTLTEAHSLLLILSGATMFLGVLGAASKRTIGNILSYHILSQSGYMVLGLALFTVEALAAALWFTIHNMVVKSSLFWIGGEAGYAARSDELKKMGGLYGACPFLGLLFLLQAFSLAGIPPLSGFWGKYLLFMETLKSGHYFLLIIAVVTSFLTLFSMIKIWLGAFLGEGNYKRLPHRSTLGWLTLSAAVAVALGFGAEVVWESMLFASEELFSPERYVKAVLGAAT